MVNDILDIENLESINLGIVGHIDHGKTTLLYKLTGKWADTHSEELKRGITIKLGYADMIIRDEKGKPLRYVSFVDAPGHEMLMATMLSGSALIDAALLVIAANEGIKPQTREHLLALQARNINQIIIIQNKIDLVTKEQALKNYKEIKDFVKGTIAENSLIIPCSAQQGVNIDKIINAILNLKIPKRDINSEPFFIVARSFDINKPGTKVEELKGGVIGGVLKKGILKEGCEIEILPGIAIKKENQFFYEPLKTKIISLFKGSYKIKKATPGGSIAIQTSLDPFITKSDGLAGNVVIKSGIQEKIKDKLKLKFNIFKNIFLEKEKIDIDPLKLQEILMLSVNTTITVGNITKLEGDIMEIQLKAPVIAPIESNVGIARNIKGHWRLIGYGEVVN
ncbi:MAG: translation initiation factor IF-2 subunit gamma [Candidatus Pacearchaeota archaeon]